MCRKSSRMERGVITEIPLHVLQMFSIHSPSISRLIGVTSHTTPLSIRRGAGGEASVNSVCRRPSVESKQCAKRSVKSVSSVREKKYPATLKRPFSYSGYVLFLTDLHRRTEHTKVHKDSGPSPDPSPRGKGSDHRDTPMRWMSPRSIILLAVL